MIECDRQQSHPEPAEHDECAVLCEDPERRQNATRASDGIITVHIYLPTSIITTNKQMINKGGKGEHREQRVIKVAEFCFETWARTVLGDHGLSPSFSATSSFASTSTSLPPLSNPSTTSHPFATTATRSHNTYFAFHLITTLRDSFSARYVHFVASHSACCPFQLLSSTHRSSYVCTTPSLVRFYSNLAVITLSQSTACSRLITSAARYIKFCCHSSRRAPLSTHHNVHLYPSSKHVS